MNKRLFLVGILFLFFTVAAWAQDQGGNESRSPWREKIFFGGGGGLQFSSIATQIALMPSVGYRITDRWSAGVTGIYQYTRWRNIDVSSHSYGLSPFTRYFVLPQVFAAAEYEQINYDIVYNDGNRRRQWVDRMLLGAGYFQGGGGRGGFYVSILYDLLYSKRQNDPSYPYQSPFVYRVGFVF